MSQSTTIPVAITVVLVVGTVGGVAFGGETNPLDSQASVADGEVEPQEDGGNNETVITPNQTAEAIQAVENETNGTVIGARLSGEREAGLNQSTFVYEFDVLAENETRLVANVYAGNATIVGVEAANESDGFFEDLFGDDQNAAEQARNVDEIRSAGEAVALAVNETEADLTNQTVTEIVLESRNDTVVYNVKLFEGEGERHEVIVAAQTNESFVTTDPEEGNQG